MHIETRGYAPQMKPSMRIKAAAALSGLETSTHTLSAILSRLDACDTYGWDLTEWEVAI